MSSKLNCIDGGACHHKCDFPYNCFRKLACLPLSGSGLNDNWTLPVDAPMSMETLVAHRQQERDLRVEAERVRTSHDQTEYRRLIAKADAIDDSITETMRAYRKKKIR